MNRVLIVDDVLGLRRAYRRVLEAHGFIVHEAADGNDAVGAAVLYQPDVITLDYVMPGGGADLIARLRAVCGARILIVTGLPLEFVDVDETTIAGRLKKPVSNVDLVTKVKALAELPPVALK